MKNTWTGRTNYHGNEITWTLNIVDGVVYVTSNGGTRAPLYRVEFRVQS